MEPKSIPKRSKIEDTNCNEKKSLRPSWGCLGLVLGRFGVDLGPLLGVIFGHVGAFFGPSWSQNRLRTVLTSKK